MSELTRGRKKDVLYACKVNEFLLYGWKSQDMAALTGVSAEDLTAFEIGVISKEGQVGADPTLPLVMGANSPKPPRITKKISDPKQASVSTYCTYNRVAEARKRGWTLAKYGRARGIRKVEGASKTMVVYVELDDLHGKVNYAWTMSKADFATYGGTLGLKSSAGLTSETEIGRLIFGGSSPRPPVVSLRLDTGAVFTSFCDDGIVSELISDGWTVKKSWLT